MELYVDEKKNDFTFKFKNYGSKELKVKYIFKENLIKMNYMFYKCTCLKSIKSIDFSKFDSSHVNNM